MWVGLTCPWHSPFRGAGSFGQPLSALFAAPVIGLVVVGHEHPYAAKGHAQVFRDSLIADSFRPHFQNGCLLRFVIIEVRLLSFGSRGRRQIGTFSYCLSLRL